MTQSTSTLPSSSTRAINCLLPMSFQDIPAGLTDREGHGRLTLVPGDAVAFDGAARGADCDRRTTVYGLQAHVHRPVGKRCGVPAADGEGAAVARPLDVEAVSTWPASRSASVSQVGTQWRSLGPRRRSQFVAMSTLTWITGRCPWLAIQDLVWQFAPLPIGPD